MKTPILLTISLLLAVNGEYYPCENLGGTWNGTLTWAGCVCTNVRLIFEDIAWDHSVFVVEQITSGSQCVNDCDIADWDSYAFCYDGEVTMQPDYTGVPSYDFNGSYRLKLNSSVDEYDMVKIKIQHTSA